ncbi:hypothetical protein MKW98_029165 [Papaver atlanticum]|uniref:Uncharacterized protein n=1 Tax=Papaver atlanticum TaxID=357466 RepID=A0AAD4X9X2_9MAGN|nr:hypothetical protein MKW98_029165 [Papaver atlanticum]
MELLHICINPDWAFTVLLVCSSAYILRWGMGIHCLIVKLGLDSIVCVDILLLLCIPSLEGLKIQILCFLKCLKGI